MYLFMFEDGDVRKGLDFSQDDKDSCDAGYLDVIDLHADNPKRWWNGRWVDVEKVETDKEAGI
jgi:hypothetical protein